MKPETQVPTNYQDQNWLEEYSRLLQETNSLYDALTSGFLEGREWLANAFSEYISSRDLDFECSLAVRAAPAWKAAEAVAKMRDSRSKMARQLKFLEYQIASYEEYFPQLIEYRDAILDEAFDYRGNNFDEFDNIDPALAYGYLKKDEYDKISDTEKFQLALDRYWERPKSRVEIGRVYERYIGYLFEKDDWNVSYYGAIKGFEDFGRDLICKKDGVTKIIQCKCWSKEKLIREKHIMQLYGTSVLYRITNKEENTFPVFITTTKLSDEAMMVARELCVEVLEINLQKYPMIKCNINSSTKNRIYHLPFDQQYDRVTIINNQGEFYADKIIEAENQGFRRAFKWGGNE
jgi:hypothetical protein